MVAIREWYGERIIRQRTKNIQMLGVAFLSRLEQGGMQIFAIQQTSFSGQCCLRERFAGLLTFLSHVGIA